MINCAVYPRKSKAVDNSDSMETQISMSKQYLDNKYGNRNYNLFIYDSDYGITGHSVAKRKDFQRMMQDIKDGKIQLVVIQRYDRIARNTRDFCNLYHDMEQAGCNLVSVSQQIDTTTPYGKKFMYDQASMAELEWALCSERRKDANRYARSIGKYTCRPDRTILGYKTEKIDGINKLVIDRETEPIVRDIFEHFKLYSNYCACAKYINEKYNMNMTNNRIKYIIKSPFFKGEYRENKAFCEPYLTIDEWNSLQVKKPVIRNDKSKSEDILFSGLIKCPSCNRRMRAQTKRKPNGKAFRYYHCEYHSTNNCNFRKVKSELLIEGMLLDYIQNFFEKQQYKFSVQEKAKGRKKKPQKEKLQAELERLNTMYQKGRITDEYYDSEYMRINTLIEKESIEQAPALDYEKIGDMFSGNWKETYSSLDKLHKKLFWKSVVDEIICDENMNVIGIKFL